MLVLSNDDVESILQMSSCMAVLKEAYSAQAQELALNIPRLDSLIPIDDQGTVYSFKTMGGVMRHGVQALRINSDIVHWPQISGNYRRVKIPKANGKWVGLVYLYDPNTGMPLAMMPDGVMQHFRVGAANGLAASYLAPANVDSLALLGSGWQAETQLYGLLEATHAKTVRVYSPSRSNREEFCQRLQARCEADLIAVDSTEEALRDATVIAAATNSMEPILDPAWIRPGVHFSVIKVQEVGAEFFHNVDAFLHTNRQRKANVISAGPVPRDEIVKGWWNNEDFSNYPDLTDLVSGKVAGRTDQTQTTVFVNNVGMGLQFAAVGGLVLEKARELNLGHTLPDDWFIESVHP